jgi:hypothetical protein
MPNRIIKESICTSEEIAKLSPEAEILFYRLMVKADDFGLYFANPKIISGTCFPLKQPKGAAVAAWIKELVGAGLIITYTVDFKDYLKLSSWEKHQQKRAAKSKYPQPQSNAIKCNQMQPRARALVFENENVNENVNENDICAPDDAPNASLSTKKEIDALFERLWSLYPRKRGKGQVKDATKRRLAEIGEEHMARCIDRFKADMETQSRAMDTYPYGSTFFNSGFVDYLDHEYTPHEVRAGPRKKLDGLQYDQRPQGENGLDKDFDDLELKP